MTANRWTDIAEFAANPVGDGYEIRDAHGSSWTSHEGMMLMIEHAQFMERIAPQLELARLARPTCDHGVPLIDDDEFTWSYNDYAPDDMFGVSVVLDGWHNDVFCCALWGTVIGDLVAVEVPR